MRPPVTSSNLFNIVLCELHHPLFHGKTSNSSLDVSEHYITLEKIDPSELFVNTNNIPLDEVDNLFVFLKIRRRRFRKFIQRNAQFNNHPSIRNYLNVSCKTTFSPQIAKCINLPGEEQVAILKTHWLRLIQRTWKKIFQQRLNVIKLRKNPRNIRYREINGKWSQCCRMPTLQGMLSPLLRR